MSVHHVKHFMDRGISIVPGCFIVHVSLSLIEETTSVRHREALRVHLSGGLIRLLLCIGAQVRV